MIQVESLFTVRRFLLIPLIAFTVGWLLSCNSSDIEEAIDLAQGVPRKDIERGYLAINSFANQSEFGTPEQQFAEIGNQLGITRVRLLFAWNDQVQPSANSRPDFSFYDFILSGLPANFRAIVVLTDTPGWVASTPNPRQSFAQQWVRRVVNRYGADPRIEGFQIWNEPNDANNPANVRLDLVGRPDNYVEMLASSANQVKDGPGGKLVILAATTAINQNYPASLDYNRGMRDAGAQEFVDVWAIHYYGSQYENVVRSGGIRDFLGGIGRPIWVTETGDQGINNQLKYGETTWPFLIDNIAGLERIYIYQFAETTPADSTYGLRNPTSGLELSDLYIWLRDG